MGAQCLRRVKEVPVPDGTGLREGKKGNQYRSNLPAKLMPLHASHFGITAQEGAASEGAWALCFALFPSLG